MKVNIIHSMRERAENRSEQMGSLNNSHTSGKGNVAGFLGEEIVLDQLIYTKLEDQYDYDIKLGSLTFDVKSKHVHTEPDHSMDATVYSGSITQNNWGYIFTRIFWDGEIYSHGWILGWILKERFFEKATEHKKGEIDPSNNYEYIGTCFNLTIAELSSIRTLIEIKMKKVSIRRFFS